MRSLFSRFPRAGTLPGAVRERLGPEQIVYVAERIHVRHRFSGSVPGLVSGWSASRHLGIVVLTRQRLYALLPSAPRLKGPVIDVRWDAAQEGPATVAISDSGLQLELDVSRVDPRFHGQLTLEFPTDVPDDVLAAIPRRSLQFEVAPEYVFHLLGVRAK